MKETDGRRRKTEDGRQGLRDEPYYAPKPLRGGAPKGARGGRFWSKRGDLCVLGVSKGLRERLEKVSKVGKGG